MVRVIIIVLCTLMCSCQLRDIEQILSTAERQLTTAPDSALTTIRSVKWYSVLKPERRAKYGLIHSIALDKNYIDVTSDSLIRFSTRYYDYKGSPEQRMRAYYYLGRVQENNREYLPAILSLLDAAQYADAVDDNYLKGLLFSRLGIIYRHYYNYEKAYEYFERSYNCYKAAGLKKHQAYQLYEMGFTLHCMNKYSNSIEYLKRAIVAANESNYNDVLEMFYSQLAIVYNAKEDYDNSYKTFILCEERFGEDNIYNYIDACGAGADTFAHKGNNAKSQRLLNKGWNLAQDKADSTLMEFYNARCLIHGEQKISGYTMYTHALYSNLQILNTAINNPQADAITKYFTQKHTIILGKEQKWKKALAILLSISIVVSILVLCIKQYAHNQRLRKMNKIISQYTELNKCFEQDIARYKKQIGDLSLAKLKDKFATINKLCETYYLYIDSPKAQTNVYKSLVNNIEELSKDKESFTNLESDINCAFDNILIHLKKEYPNISTNEYKLACYLCAGFSTPTICVLLKCDKDALYRRIYRLREKVRALDNQSHCQPLLHN